MSQVVVVIGGGPLSPRAVTEVTFDATIIAADSGLDHAVAAGLKPTVLVGDLDSISAHGKMWAYAHELEIDEHPVDKEATDTELSKIVAAVAAGRLAGAGKIGIRVGKVIGRYKMAKHYNLTITDDTFAFTRNQEQITAEAALDGLYVIRTTVRPEQMDTAKVVATYKSLARVERDFRSLKAIDLDLRPIHHYTESRVRAHVFICMLAAYLVWHLRQAWAPLTFTDEHRPNPAAQNTYNLLYALYRQLHDSFGGLNQSTDLSRLMKELLALKQEQSA